MRAENFDAQITVEVAAKPRHGDTVTETLLIDNSAANPAEGTVNIEIPPNVPVTIECYKR